MNTKVVTTICAVFLGIIGILLTFAPQEISLFFNLNLNKIVLLMLQVIGALYFSFAMLNWMIRGGVIGGIYNKPAVTANFIHFFIVAMALIKSIISDHSIHFVFWILAVVYTIFAGLYGFILQRHPRSIDKK
jgi:Na+-driven multidrug efflux pump